MATKNNPGPAFAESKISALLFADVKGFSKLSDGLAQRFSAVVLSAIAKQVDGKPCDCINTWGDAIFGVYPDPNVAADVAVLLRDYFRNTDWSREGFPNDLGIRIALHAARVYCGINPITNRPDVMGENVNLTARIEPVVTTNEVWATRAFVELLKNNPQYRNDPLGTRELVKGWGELDLYRLRRKNDPDTPLAVPALTVPSPTERLVGPRRSEAVREIVHRIIKNADKDGGFLSIAAIAHKDLFGPIDANDSIHKEIQDLLKSRPAGQGDGNPVRILFLDPEADAAHARETFETNPNRPVLVTTRMVIGASLHNARAEQTGHQNLHIRLAAEMPGYYFFNQEEMLYHPYLSSAVGADTQVTLATAPTAMYAHARQHFENHWRGRWVLLDLGKVLIPFSHEQVSGNLWRHLSESLPAEQLPKLEALHAFFFEGRGARPSRNAELEVGSHGISWLHAQFCQEFRCGIDVQKFQDIWNDIFVSEHSEARDFIRRMQDRGICVGICSNTNESHWAWICTRYTELVTMVNAHFLSYKLKARKPDRKFFEEICKRTHVPAWHHLLIDDLQVNVDGARLAGMRGELFEESFHEIEQGVEKKLWPSTYHDDVTDGRLKHECRELGVPGG